MNILVTGVGAIIGYGIIRSLRAIKEYNITIVGMDIYADAYGRFLCDKFYIADRADSETYLECLLQLIQNEKIHLIIPGIEQDMYKMNQLKEFIPTRIVLNNELLIELSKDKLSTYQYFKDVSELDLIPTITDCSYDECLNKLGSPFLLKPRSSYASKGICKIYSQEDYLFYHKKGDNNLFQRIVGTNDEEYTVSVFGDGNGSYIDYIILKRTLAQTGATDKAVVVESDTTIIEYVDCVCHFTKPVGPTNIQLRKEDGRVYLLEINPRISSACSIRSYAGYNEPLMCIKYYLENSTIHPLLKKKVKAVRFVDDFFYE